MKDQDHLISVANFGDTTNYNDKYCYSGTYLHGKIESDYGYDIFSFQRESNYKQGIHFLRVNFRECIFVLWNDTSRLYEYRGYLVYADDTEAVEYALSQYNRKANHI